MDASETTRFFVSYTQVDRAWAEWVAWKLEDKGYEAKNQAWDIRPGHDFMEKMNEFIDESDILIAILSPHYLQSDYCKYELNPFLGDDPSGDKRKVIFVRVTPFDLPRHVKTRVYIDLANMDDEDQAAQTLFNGLRADGKPLQKPPFPRKTSATAALSNQPIFPGRMPSYWLMPHKRNPFFTGREDILTQIHQAFQQGGALAITQAIKGLGGVGKTQTAVEYAYRYRHEYDAIFWARAEKSGDLYADFADFGKKLAIVPEGCKDEEAFALMRDWLGKNRGWLLVLDNVEDIAEARAALPSPCLGHALITTRNKAVGDFHDIKLDCLPDEEGALLLLRRSKTIGKNDPPDTAPEPKQTQALALTRELGGLPLALDQAGAYIEENDCSLDEYMQIYQMNKNILADRGKLSKGTHPDSVTVTFSLCFEKVQKASPAAADLLRICAFLAPDRIPEEIFTEGVDELPEALANSAGDTQTWLEHLRFSTQYSLIERDVDNKTLSLHRLVQIVIREEITESERKEWAERCVRILNRVYPSGNIKFEEWSKCARLTPHIQSLFAYIEEFGIETIETAQLCKHTGYYLFEQARYTEAMPLYLCVIAIDEKALGSDYPQLAMDFNNLAELYREQGKYAEAEPLYLRAIAIDEKALGADHPGMAINLNNLSIIYLAQGKYVEAESLLLRVIAIDEKALDANHPQLATHLNNLAELYRGQGKYDKAESLNRRAIAIAEKALGADHPQFAVHLNNLANFYNSQGKYTEAEPLYLQAIAITEKAFCADHPNLAVDLHNLAFLYKSQCKYAKAEPLYLRAIAIWEKTLPSDHPDLATGYENYAHLLQETGRIDEANEYFRKVREIRERRGEEIV